MKKSGQKSKINSENQYKERLKELRQFYNFSFDARNKLTPQRKAAITRAEKDYRENVKPLLNRGSKFEDAGRRKRKSVAQNAAGAVSTPKGYIIPKARNFDSSKYDPQKKATISKKGEATAFTYKISPEKFISDPRQTVANLPDYNKAVGIVVNVGKGAAFGSQTYSPSAFFAYASELLEDDDLEDFFEGITLIFGDDDE